MNAVPDMSVLGTVNGIGQSVGSTARMMGQPFVSVFTSSSLNGKELPVYLIYGLLVSITAVGVVMASFLPRKLKE